MKILILFIAMIALSGCAGQSLEIKFPITKGVEGYAGVRVQDKSDFKQIVR